MEPGPTTTTALALEAMAESEAHLQASSVIHKEAQAEMAEALASTTPPSHPTAALASSLSAMEPGPTPTTAPASEETAEAEALLQAHSETHKAVMLETEAESASTTPTSAILAPHASPTAMEPGPTTTAPASEEPAEAEALLQAHSGTRKEAQAEMAEA